MGASQMKNKNENAAILDVNGKVYELPLVVGSENEVALDISNLRAQSGIVTLDPAYVNTGSCLSEITFLNGEKGILRYRGYPIEYLSQNASFIEVVYLLIYGSIPSKDELDSFSKSIAEVSKRDHFALDLIKNFQKNAHPMGILSSLLTAQSTVKPELQKQDISVQEQKDAMIHLLAITKNYISYIYRHTHGLDIVDSDSGKNYCADFLNMMFSGTDVNYNDSVIEEALNVLLILHADHEQNCSTSTVRMVGSSKANLYATIASGVNALWGPLHGGANQAVIEMLEQIQSKGGNYKEFLNKAKDKDDPFKLMGFGHRVYKNFDPRAKIIKKSCDNVLEKLGVNDPLLDIAKGLEEEALKDPYFVDRKLYPNVDFYSGIIYKALNIPTNMFTTMFALGRMPGWLAQWYEMINDPKMKINRPRQIYIGKNER